MFESEGSMVETALLPIPKTVLPIFKFHNDHLKELRRNPGLFFLIKPACFTNNTIYDKFFLQERMLQAERKAWLL